MITQAQKRYLFAIYLLARKGGSVRSSAVSDMLGVSKASTVKMARKLIEERYIIKEPYRDIKLTPEGIRAANELYTPSVILQSFLHDTLGVSSEKADEDSVVIASQISDETLEKLVSFSLEMVPSSNVG